MNPSVYLYQVSEECHELYLGEFSTLDGLCLFAEAAPLSLVDFGATDSKGYGWSSAKDLPRLSTVGELKVFLNRYSDLNLIDFEAELVGIGSISSHDDGECHFSFPDKEKCFAVLERAAPQQFYKLLGSTLMSNPGSYVTCDAEGKIAKYPTFEHYLAVMHA
jgi:hypothetical protein